MLKKMWHLLVFILSLPLAPIIGIHTTVGFAEAVNSTSLVEVEGAPDQHVRVVGDDVYIGEYNKIVGACAIHESCRLAKLMSPSLRRFFNPFINPKVSLSGDSSDPIQGMDIARNPIPLATNEALNAWIHCSGAEATLEAVVGVNLAKAGLAPVFGAIHTLRIQGSGTISIGVWTNHSLTLGVDLPVGRYQLVGAECWSNYCGLFRLVPVGEDFRPGGVMVDDRTPTLHHPNTINQRQGNWGVWCEFDQLTPPSLDMLPANGSGTWYVLYLDLIKVA